LVDNPDDISKVHSALEDLANLAPLLGSAATPPRMLAIIGCSYLETYLQQILEERMPGLNSELSKKLFTHYGPLATMSAKIDLGRALGVIPPKIHKALIAANRVRNRFAHSFDIHDFEHPDVKPLADELIQLIVDPSFSANGSRAKNYMAALIGLMTGFSTFLHPNNLAKRSASPDKSS